MIRRKTVLLADRFESEAQERTMTILKSTEVFGLIEAVFKVSGDINWN